MQTYLKGLTQGFIHSVNEETRNKPSSGEHLVLLQSDLHLGSPKN